MRRPIAALVVVLAALGALSGCAVHAEPGRGVSVTGDVAYGPSGGMTLDVCAPAAAAASTGPSGATRQPGRAAILSIHGGGWRGGDKRDAQWRASCEWLASEGFVVFQANYRLAPEHPFPAAIDDVRAVLRWMRDAEQVAEYGIDPARVGVFGDSAGGNLAALLALEGDDATDDSERVAAAVTISAPFDLTAQAPGEVGDGFDQVQFDYLGCTGYAQCPAAAAASPSSYVDPSDPPFYIVHARSDALIPVEQAEAMRGALEAASIDTTLRVIPGDAHALSALDDAMRREIAVWLTEKTAAGS